MGGEAFYTTAAQVLPTLLIAISVEAVLMSRESIEDAKRSPDTASAALVPDFTPMAVFVGVSFFAGETAALTALIFGAEGWVAWTIGPIATVALLALCAYAAVLPLARLKWAMDGSDDGVVYIPRVPAAERLILRRVAAVVDRYVSGDMRDTPRDQAVAAIGEVTRDPVLLGILAGTLAAEPRGARGRIVEILQDAGADMTVAADQEIKAHKRHRRSRIRGYRVSKP